ncbi:MAG: glycosyltransferase [Thermoproteota archaeon]
MVNGRKVCILSTVHPPFDVRIFYKQARTLNRAGYQVTLIAQHARNEVVDGIKILALPKPKNRLIRILGLTWRAFCLALREKADVYHFHDPELIPFMFLLRLLRLVPVIYDVHEDYKTGILQKNYLSPCLRSMAAWVLTFLERISAYIFQIVLAEKYYAERFPSGITVLNYPVVNATEDSHYPAVYCVDAPRVLYTGGVSEERGAMIYAGLVHLLPSLHVYLVGRCEPDLATRLYKIAAPHESRLHLEGVGFYVPHSRIQAYYSVGGWVAGLALFPPNEFYERKELTKLFEYMAARIPIICSNFSHWKEIVEGNRCGITVDPLNPKAITEAITFLITHPEEARMMGENGRRAVEEKYNWEREAKKLLTLYEELLAS